MSLLSRYLVGRYMTAFTLALVGATGLYLILDFFLRIEDFASYGSDASTVATYFVLRVPEGLSQVYPAAALFAVLISMGALAESREVTAMHACGVSVWRMAAPLLAAATVVSVIMMGWNELVVPTTATRARAVKNLGIRDMRNRGLFNASSIWFQTERGFVNVDYYDANRKALYGIRLHELDAEFALRRVLDAPEALWRNDAWQIREGTVKTFGPGSAEDPQRSLRPGEITIGNTPDEFRRKRRGSDEFSYRDLARQIGLLQHKGLDASEFLVDLHFKLALPFSGLVGVLMGFPLAVRQGRRTSSTSRRVGQGMAVCFLYWTVMAASIAAGHQAKLPPVIAAWAPNVLFSLLGALFYTRTSA